MASLGTHIPKEITDYKEKIIGGLTLRQLTAGAAAIIAGGLTFFLCFSIFGLNAQQSSYFIMAAAALPAAVGFVRPQDMDFEKYLLMRYRHWQRSKPISYKTTKRGDTDNVSVSSKASKAKGSKFSDSECIVDYYIYSRRRERRIIRSTRKHIRLVRKEVKKIQRSARKQSKA